MAANPTHFASGRDVHNFFRSSKQDIALDRLKGLRNQLSLKPGEDSVTLHDARLLLAKEWLDLSSGAQDVFAVLDKRPSPAIEAICLSILSSLMNLTSYHLVYQPLGYEIVKTLLAPRWLRKLSILLSGGQSELCIATLKLLNSMSSFAGGKEQKALLESFPLEVKTFQKLLFMRRKEKHAARDALSRPDIRTLCLQFILSFLSVSSHVKSTFLEQHRDVFLSIFKGLSGDPYSVVQYVLETLWTKLWQDQKVKRTLKVGLFGEKTLQHLLKLYDRSEQDGSDPNLVPANVIHHFLLAICTHRGVGICFADNGWYPRQENDREVSGKVEKMYNKILASVLKMLKVGDDARQQELALKILQACPELAAGYLQFLAPMLEPRLSSKWLAIVAQFGAVISLPVPTDCFHLRPVDPSSSTSPGAYRPDPPPLSTVVDNIVPSTILKTHLTKALQSPHPLVQHTAGLLLAQCLGKYEAARNAFRQVEQALEENEVEGQWARRLNEVEREIRKRVPDISVVIAFAGTHQAVAEPNIKSAMLADLSQRLLWLYHRCLPSLVMEARYDLAKSLKSILSADNNDVRMSAEIAGLKRLQQLHVIRMLTESDQFVWRAKAASSGPSNLYILLDLYLKTEHPSIRQAVSTLLTQAVRDSLLFQHDPEELQIWLEALPTNIRSGDAETPDRIRLLDERQCVMSFLEACMLRCAKTPHRYIEELDLMSVSSGETGTGSSISPVIITVLEQLNAKIRTRALGPSDALALTTFIRRVMVALLGKQLDFKVLSDLAANLRTAVTAQGAFAESPTITAALRRECDILDDCLAWCSSTLQVEADMVDTATPDAVTDFAAKVEELQNSQPGVTQAYELVDWLRLVDQPLTPSIVARVAAVIKRLHSPALSCFCLHLLPRHGLLWALADEDLANNVPIGWMLFHANRELVEKGRCMSVLRAALQKDHRSLYQYRGLVGLLIHRLHEQASSEDIVSVCEILARLFEHAKKDLSSREFSALKMFAWSERKNLRQLACASDLTLPVIAAIGRLVEVMLDAASLSDQQLASPICDYWVSAVVDGLEHASWQNLSGSTLWIEFMSHDALIAITEQLLRTLQHSRDNRDAAMNQEVLHLAEVVLTVLADCDDGALSIWLNQHLAALLSLRRFLSTSQVLDRIILRSISAGLPIGCDGLHVLEEGVSLRDAIERAQLRWSSRLLPLPPDASLSMLLDESDWSTALSDTITAFVYRSPDACRSFWHWLKTGDLARKPALKKLVPVIHAFFDSGPGKELLDKGDVLFAKMLFDAVASQFCANSLEESDTARFGSCLVDMIKCLPSQRDNFLKRLSELVNSIPADTLHWDALCMVHPLMSVCEGVTDLIGAVLSHALSWVVRHMSETQTSADLDELSLAAIIGVVQLSRTVVSHFAEPVVTVAIRHHIRNAPSMRLAEVLLSKVSIKAASINRHLQSIIQHPQFPGLASSDVASDERKAIAKLLFSLFHTHPANTCQPSHVEPLLQLYSGSLSVADRLVLSIFRLYEEQRQISVASLIRRWLQSNLSNQEACLDTLLALDPIRVFRTCLLFPTRRMMSDGTEEETIVSIREDGQLYDPAFLLLLFAQMLEERFPQSAVSWVSLYRTNVVSMLIRCLSSADEAVRKIALSQLGKLYVVMQAADMQEKSQIIYLLDHVRYLLQKPLQGSDDGVTRLPSYTTLFLAHALRGIMYPASFTYPLTARFLLQRPTMDKQDVPMLYSMLFSSTDGWRKERAWIVRFLADGMADNDDWRLIKRRHAWDLLASLFQGSYGDRALRHSILDVLANLTCQCRATASLIVRSSLVHWIEIQLAVVNQDEALTWTKIIENILVVATIDQAEQATRGEWQRGLLRCLTRLIPSSDIRLLCLISRTLTRLGSERPRYCSSVKHTLSLALARLRVLEDTDDLARLMCITPFPNDNHDLPPHRSTGLHQPLFAHCQETWGRTVEHLWSVTMRSGVNGPVSDELTSRLLLWRAIAGERVSPLGEWARRQAVTCMRM